MNRQKGFSILVITLIIAGVVVVAGGGVLLYQHYYLAPKSIVVSECQTQKNCQDIYKNCYYTCSDNKCVQINTFVALKPYPDCSSNLTCTPNWQCDWGECTNGYQGQVAIDSNNCGLPSSTAQIACPALARVCTSSAQPSITILSPNGGETWQNGTKQQIEWSVSKDYQTSNVSIKLSKYFSCPATGACNMGGAPVIYTITDSVNSGIGRYIWNVGDIKPSAYSGSLQSVPDGQYEISIRIIGTNFGDSSDNYFTIVAQ